MKIKLKRIFPKNRANTIIYYSPNGESHIEFLEKSRKEKITWYLFNFLKKNEGKTIIMVLVQLIFSSYPIYFTINAEFHGVWLIFNPPLHSKIKLW